MDLENPVYITENDGSANELETDIPRETTRIASSYEIDQQLQAELENGYSWEEPMVIQNPYQVSPLTAVIIFDTKEECAVRFTVKGKTEAARYQWRSGSCCFTQNPGDRSLPGNGKYSCSGASG